uniref:Archaemetzincin-2 n=1 Tax=Arcella intermedia TaxID=1963864 RepID=A0A6B2LAW3_9EUKA
MKPSEQYLYKPHKHLFKPIPKPNPDDWLAGPGRNESMETFQDFHKKVRHRLPMTNQVIYVLPIGSFTGARVSPDLQFLKEYCTAFFTLEANFLPEMEVIAKEPEYVLFEWKGQTYKIGCRERYGTTQLLTSDLNSKLEELKESLPDAFCIIGITMYDLYPEEGWNFVFGEARLSESVGVFSFIRYLNNPSEFYLNCCKVMTHEIGHMFGIDHCCYFHCLMNGSNTLEESSSQPMFLCPMDLHKLQHYVKFDVLQRYQDLLTFLRSYPQHFGTNNIQWLETRCKSLSSQNSN